MEACTIPVFRVQLSQLENLATRWDTVIYLIKPWEWNLDKLLAAGVQHNDDLGGDPRGQDIGKTRIVPIASANKARSWLDTCTP